MKRTKLSAQPLASKAVITPMIQRKTVIDCPSDHFDQALDAEPTEEEHAGDHRPCAEADAEQLFAEEAAFEGFEIDGHVGKFRHAERIMFADAFDSLVSDRLRARCDRDSALPHGDAEVGQ